MRESRDATTREAVYEGIEDGCRTLCRGALTVEQAADYVRVQLEQVEKEVVEALRLESQWCVRARRKVAEVRGRDEVGLERLARLIGRAMS